MKYFYETYKTPGGWRWKVYHYDATGQQEIVTARSDTKSYVTEEQAADACAQWLDDYGIGAELA